MRRVLLWSIIAVLIATTSAHADRQLFVVDLPNEPASLDPHVQWDTDSVAVYRNIFDNLVTRDSTGTIVPQVAASWQYETDTKITFSIRDDIRFIDGSKLTAEDVAFSVRRITAPGFKSPQLGQFDAITSAEVTGPSKVTLTTRSAYPVLMAQLVKLSIVPQSIVEKVGDVAFNQHPVGSGPYAFVSRAQGVRIELVANPAYWRGPPPFQRVEFRPVPDGTTRIADVRTGRADLARIVSTDDADGLRSDSQVKVVWVPSERVRFIGLNTISGLLTDRRVREAVAHAIDKDLLITALLKGYARPLSEPLAPIDFGWTNDLLDYQYDPARARALLAEAGVKPGTAITHLTFQGLDQRVVQAIDQMLADVGLDARVSMVDQPTFIRLKLGAPETAGDLSFQGWSCSCADADGTLFALFHSSSPWSKYRNPDLDILLEQARRTLDGKARLTAYKRALELLHADVAVVPLYQEPLMYVARKPVAFQPTADEAFFLFDIRWNE